MLQWDTYEVAEDNDQVSRLQGAVLEAMFNLHLYMFQAYLDSLEAQEARANGDPKATVNYQAYRDASDEQLMHVKRVLGRP